MVLVGGSDFAVERYNANAALDSSFGTGGIESVPFKRSNATVLDTALQPDGKIIAAGSSFNSMALARYNNNGRLDTSFGHLGVVTTTFGEGRTVANSVALQSDGKIVLAGYAVVSQQLAFALARYNSDGNLDPTFGVGGVLTTTQRGGAYAVAVQPDGKILAGGNDGYGSSGGDFVLARFNSDGTPDLGFGAGGVSINAFGGSQIRDVAIQSDGKIVAVGGGGIPDRRFTIARYNTDGSLDTAFGTNGVVYTDFTGYDEAHAVALLPNGKILVAGQVGQWPPADFGIAQYNSDGSLDTSFGTGGKTTTDFGGDNDEGHALATQADGRFVVVGPTQFKIARYTVQGTLDPEFGNGGKEVDTFITGANAESALIQADGKIVVAGASFLGSDQFFALARYKAADEPSPTPGTPTATPTACPITFSDVHPTDYFYEAVSYLYCRGVISGYGDNTFRPNNLTTRGRLSKIVVLAENLPIFVPLLPTFQDVPVTHAFYPYIETAYHLGIISGYSCGTGCLEFRPGNNVTRGQLCKIVVLAEGWAIYTPPSPTFQDVPTTDPFYQYIETAYSHTIISGYSCGTNCLEFRPGNNATRGQICKI